MPPYNIWPMKPGDTQQKPDAVIHLEKEVRKPKPPPGIPTGIRLSGKEKVRVPGPVERTPVTLTYPLDIKAQSFYPEAIKFTPYKRHTASLEKVQEAMKQAWKDFGDLTTKKINQDRIKSSAGDKYAIYTGGTKEQNQAYAASQALKNGSSEEGAEKYLKTVWDYISTQTYASEIYEAARMILSEATSGLRQPPPGSESTFAMDPIMFLNMPNEISFAEPVAWEGHDLGMLGAIAKSEGTAWQAGTLANLSNLVGGGAGFLAGMLAKHSTGILKGLGPLGGALLGTLGGTTIQKMGESSFGNIANPYKEMTFSGIGFREFAFNFVFRARSSEEVRVVQDIIENFRFRSKPRTTHGGSVMTYPDEFMIEFLTKPEVGKDGLVQDRFITNPYIPQLKMCVCKSVNTNFTSQNTWRTLKSGHPVEISLALTFEETELVTGDDVIGETSFGRFKDSGGRF